MYFFTNYNKNILGDTFLSWYDSGKPQTYLYKGYPTISDLMVAEYGKSDKSAKKDIIEVLEQLPSSNDISEAQRVF